MHDIDTDLTIDGEQRLFTGDLSAVEANARSAEGLQRRRENSHSLWEAANAASNVFLVDASVAQSAEPGSELLRCFHSQSAHHYAGGEAVESI